MLKLLVVDDEPIIRKGIRYIIDWEQYGYEICGEAEDGPTAVEAIDSLKPDLTLLDMHLPGFSGIEVIRKIRRGTRFLILSGYADFEYAKEAVNLGAKGYIVKPVEETLLIERIVNIAEEIKKEKLAEQNEETWRELPRIQFLEIMKGNTIHRESCFKAALVQAAAIDEDSAADKAGSDGMLQKLSNFLPGNSCRLFPYREYIILLFEDTPEITVRRLLEKLHDYYPGNRHPQGQNTAEQMPAKHIAITLGSRCRENANDPGAGIRKTCREADSLMAQVFFHRDKKFITLNDSQNQGLPAAPRKDIEQAAAELCAYIQIIDHEKIRRFFKNLEAGYTGSGKQPREIRQECMALMIETRNSLLGKFPALREMLGTGKEILDAIMELRYLGDMTDKMAETSQAMSECLPLLSADSSLQRIVSYVQNNFSEDLRLESLGRLFNYNCAYLGKRFKEYTGKSFHTYLDMLRINTARKLLRTTSMKVYEISETVGYANTDYFYSKFKKYAGESPQVFRKKKGEYSEPAL